MVRERVNISRVVLVTKYASPEEVVHKVVYLQYLGAETCPA
jgi:hypothetical protein